MCLWFENDAACPPYVWFVPSQRPGRGKAWRMSPVQIMLSFDPASTPDMFDDSELHEYLPPAMHPNTFRSQVIEAAFIK